ncbi:transposase [Sphingomonas sp. UYP23]
MEIQRRKFIREFKLKAVKLVREQGVSLSQASRQAVGARVALIIYSGGFPSLSTLSAITRLACEAKDPMSHCGDMVAGGIRNPGHLERCLAREGVQLRPHLMDEDLLERTGAAAGKTISPMGNLSGSAVEDLADFIRKTGLVHEQ